MLILVIEVCIAVGERVEKGQAVVVLESMETDWFVCHQSVLFMDRETVTYFLRHSFAFSIEITLLLVLSFTRANEPFVSLIVPT